MGNVAWTFMVVLPPIALAAASAVLSMIAGVLYVKDILSGGDTRPNAVSFFLWTVLQAIAAAAQIKAGPSWSLVVVLFLTLNTATVTILALVGYGYRRYGRLDFLCAVIALGAAYLLVRSPVGAIFFAIIGDLSAFIPVYLKAWRDPASEHLPAWVLVMLSSLFGALATDAWDLPNLIFPVYATVSNGLVIAFVLAGRGRLAYARL
jgi:hypothetical protein